LPLTGTAGVWTILALPGLKSLWGQVSLAASNQRLGSGRACHNPVMKEPTLSHQVDQIIAQLRVTHSQIDSGNLGEVIRAENDAQWEAIRLLAQAVGTLMPPSGRPGF
jgi:hypothetical protein